MVEKTKQWYKSKTKWAAILGGLMVAAPGVISWLEGGDIGLMQILEGAALILAVFGIRDLPIINKAK